MPKGWNHKLTTTAITAAAIGLAVGTLLWVWWDGLAVLSVITGVALGWAMGILLAPYDLKKRNLAVGQKRLPAFLAATD